MEIISVRGHGMAVSDNNREDQELERQKCKKTRPQQEKIFRRLPMELVLGIRSAEDIDDVDSAAEMRRWYCVLYWIEPDQVHRTRAVQTSTNDPIWHELDYLLVRDYIPGYYGFLNVEIARLCSDTDPGTSSGTVIVGRARVPLPSSPYRTVEGNFNLVRPIGEGHMCLAGEIYLCMKLQRPLHLQQPDNTIINDQ